MTTTPCWPIWLRYHRNNFVGTLIKVSEEGYREFRSSHKNNSHSFLRKKKEKAVSRTLSVMRDFSKTR
jgi:hypothetical protein